MSLFHGGTVEQGVCSTGGSGTESLFHGGTLERETAQVREGPFGHEVWENEKGNLEYTIFWPTDEPWVAWVKLELQ